MSRSPDGPISIPVIRNPAIGDRRNAWLASSTATLAMTTTRKFATNSCNPGAACTRGSTGSRCAQSTSGHRAAARLVHQRDHLRGETLHFSGLWAELQQQQVDPDALELDD